MLATDSQTLQDLEFNVITEWLENFCIGKTAQAKIRKLAPTSNFSKLEFELKQLDELRQIRVVNDTLPAIDFEELESEIKLLSIEDAVISIEGFRRIYQASDLVNRLLKFFETRSNRYPLLTKILQDCEYNDEINKRIDEIFDRAGNVKDDASPQLAEIRQRIKALRNQINRNFEREMRKLLKDKILGDVTEGFISERRVLTVLSSFKRKVPGNVHGSSKTGSLTYVEPMINVPLNNEMEFLLDDERKEIHRILKQLTRLISVHAPLITAYQKSLVIFDFVNAKCKLALEMKAVLPGINRKVDFELVEAYHPILRRNNSLHGKTTKPQRIVMNGKNRMLVISGPNAGGKSITLKTIGLLQIMLQSGLLIPVNENSKVCFFQQIISDIGDNQSIENELSTYSYRLQRMHHFLQVANSRTLLLLDEFGTGSDPELGGALAEVFFEEIYNKSAFGVITTHYGNIKLKANVLQNAVNGCMLFDSDTLKPKYEFAIGQPGSSFTFEVAKMNGIPNEMIEKAKGLLDDKKVKLDRLLNDLQKEKNYLERLNKEHQEAQRTAEEARIFFTERKEKLDERLKSQQQISENNNKQLIAGKKMLSFIEKFNVKSRKKDANNTLIEEIRTFLRLEKSKTELKIQQEKQKELELKQSKAPKKIKKPIVEEDIYKQSKIKIGSTVQLIATKQKGTVESMTSRNISVIFGNARLKVELEKLQLIKE
ncbi:MAG: DNA mismatch repair protein MutS [Flavobacteriales bacterium]|nr:DNA mismatch repair protein MutS [Flavobacteriales bacterium]